MYMLLLHFCTCKGKLKISEQITNTAGKISIEHFTILPVNMFLKVLLTWNVHQMLVTTQVIHTYKENK